LENPARIREWVYSINKPECENKGHSIGESIQGRPHVAGRRAHSWDARKRKRSTFHERIKPECESGAPFIRESIQNARVGHMPLKSQPRMREWHTFHWRIKPECESVAHSNRAHGREARTQLGRQNVRVGCIPLENPARMRELSHWRIKPGCENGYIPVENQAKMRESDTFHWRIDPRTRERSREARAHLGRQNSRMGHIP
jgi:hypothetical protein